MKKLSFCFAVALIATFSLPAFAGISLYTADLPPRQISADFQLSANAFHSGTKLNKALAGQELIRFFSTQQQALRIRQPDGESLQLRKVHGTALGFTFRFTQRFFRKHIEGAEILAIFDRTGRLTALNSSLILTPERDLQPQISSRDAFSRAMQLTHMQDPELGHGLNDGLVVSKFRDEVLLAWQFSVREHSMQRRALQIQVVASGPGTGKLLRVLRLGQGAAGAAINIFDAQAKGSLDKRTNGVLVLQDGKQLANDSISDEARAADINFHRIREFYARNFNRIGFDNQGSDIDASVNLTSVDSSDVSENAAWFGPWKLFIFGKGTQSFAGFAAALEVVAHEFTHAVIENTSALIYAGESGAMNESLADVFGALIRAAYEKPANMFVIGDTVIRGPLKKSGQGIRDMLFPEKGLTPQPGTMSQIPGEFRKCRPNDNNDNCGVHIMSGVPNRAAALSIQALGLEPATQLFYRVMTGRLRSSSGFADFRDQTLAECRTSFDASRCSGVQAAFAAVGL